MDFPKFIANCRRVVEKTAHFIENWQRLPKQDQIGQDTRTKKTFRNGKTTILDEFQGRCSMTSGKS